MSEGDFEEGKGDMRGFLDSLALGATGQKERPRNAGAVGLTIVNNQSQIWNSDRRLSAGEKVGPAFLVQRFALSSHHYMKERVALLVRVGHRPLGLSVRIV